MRFHRPSMRRAPLLRCFQYRADGLASDERLGPPCEQFFIDPAGAAASARHGEGGRGSACLHATLSYAKAEVGQRRKNGKIVLHGATSYNHHPSHQGEYPEENKCLNSLSLMLTACCSIR